MIIILEMYHIEGASSFDVVVSKNGGFIFPYATSTGSMDTYTMLVMRVETMSQHLMVLTSPEDLLLKH